MTTLRSSLRPRNTTTTPNPMVEVPQRDAVKNKLGELYLEWLSLPKTQHDIASFVDNKQDNLDKVKVNSQEDMKNALTIMSTQETVERKRKNQHLIEEGELEDQDKENFHYSLHQQQQQQQQKQHVKSSKNSSRHRSPPRSPHRNSGRKLGMTSNDKTGISFTEAEIIRSGDALQSLKLNAGSGPAAIPQFYFPRNKGGSLNVSSDDLMREKIRIKEAFFSASLRGFDVDQFREVMASVCGLPYFLCSTLFQKIDSKNTGRVALNMFERYWFENDMPRKNNSELVFHVLCQPTQNCIVPSDFKIMMEELLFTHPSLDFLQQSDKLFQLKYMQTVIIRIFYTINKSGNGRISFRELEQSPLVDSLYKVHREDNINVDEEFFSYEHFYVLYCKFFELDQDHDFMISKEDLLQYGGHCLSMKIVDRVFAGYGKSLTAKKSDMMSYEDFIWFCMSEEDKSTPMAQQYWFRSVDVDSDGVISIGDMEYFYQEQVERMERLGLEPISFADIYSQLVDLVKPKNHDRFTMSDIVKSKSCSVFFSVLFNLNKLVLFDQGVYKPTDGCGEWTLFANEEHARLAAEEQ